MILSRLLFQRNQASILELKKYQYYHLGQTKSIRTVIQHIVYYNCGVLAHSQDHQEARKIQFIAWDFILQGSRNASPIATRRNNRISSSIRLKSNKKSKLSHQSNHWSRRWSFQGISSESNDVQTSLSLIGKKKICEGEETST